MLQLLGGVYALWISGVIYYVRNYRNQNKGVVYPLWFRVIGYYLNQRTEAEHPAWFRAIDYALRNTSTVKSDPPITTTSLALILGFVSVFLQFALSLTISALSFYTVFVLDAALLCLLIISTNFKVAFILVISEEITRARAVTYILIILIAAVSTFIFVATPPSDEAIRALN
jgi:hypothetical protein